MEGQRLNDFIFRSSEINTKATNVKENSSYIWTNIIETISATVMAREWEGQLGTWRIARLGIIDTKDRKGKERENYLMREMQALYSPPRREGGSHLTYLE